MPKFTSRETTIEVETGTSNRGIDVRIREVVEGAPNRPLLHFEIPADQVWKFIQGSAFNVEGARVQVYEEEL